MDKMDQSLLESVEKLIDDYEQKGKTPEEIREHLKKIDMKEFCYNYLDVSVEMLIKSYQEELEISIQKHKKEYEVFQDKLNNIWMEGFRYSEELYHICSDILYDCAQNRKNQKFSYMLEDLEAISIRACQVYLEVMVLVKNGFPDGAWARWRTMYELSIIAQFISENGEKTAKAYYDTSFSLSDYEWARTASSFKKYNPQWKVTFKAIFKRCKKINKKADKFYKSASVAVHPSALGTFGRIGTCNGDVGIGPTIYGLAQEASHAAQSLNMVMLAYLKCMKGMYTTIETMVITKWTDEIKRIYKEIEENLERK